MFSFVIFLKNLSTTKHIQDNFINKKTFACTANVNSAVNWDALFSDPKNSQQGKRFMLKSSTQEWRLGKGSGQFNIPSLKLT